MTVCELANEIERLLRDVDYNTADASLKIARILIEHKEKGALEFQSDSTISGLSQEP